MALSTPPAHAAFDDPLHARIASLIYREAGIVLGPEKVSMMNARLTRRLAATGSRSFAEYVDGVTAGRWPSEIEHVISALTTNFTNFLREGHHFDFLRDVVFRDAAARQRPLEIWSAGCSSGQEPYSIALTGRRAGLRLSITGSDVDQSILRRAERGIYSAAETASVPDELKSLGFENRPEGLSVRASLREMVTFRQMNLHDDWPFVRPFDAIFCRNVIIYFDAAAQLRLWQRFRQQLRPGGWLFIGHSERIPDELRDELRRVGQTVYQHFPK